MKSFRVRLLLRLILPVFTRWAEKQEATILNDGRPLSEWETMWAQDVGVKNPQKVRILPVPRIPLPRNLLYPLLKYLFTEDPEGMAINYGIYLEASRATNPSLLVHELAHVAQYERLGGIEAFVREYITQWAESGYWKSQLEQEARTAAEPFTRPPGG